MHSNLALVLLNRGIIRQGTVIELYHNVCGLSCAPNTTVLAAFVIVAAKLRNRTGLVFEALNSERDRCRIVAEQIVKIDGMLVERVAISQNLTAEGEELKKRSQRARRTRSRRMRVLSIEQRIEA